MSQNQLRDFVWHPNDRLISTKLHVPPLKSRMLPREHLVDRLSAGKDSRLIVILGVAASGKTSLTCQWINKDKLPAAWYSLDKTDNEFDIFFRYFVAALSKVESELASALLPRLQSRRKLSTKEIIPLIIERLTDLPRDIYLILDDYHLITSGEIHDALSYFLNHMPPKMHMVLISRHNIPFSLAHCKVRNQITEISPQDMRFNDEETGKYFAEIIPVKLSTDEVRELARYTEGWVGALQLVGLSLKGKETLHGLSNVLNRALYETTDYLIDEVIKLQPEKVENFLCITALLERFNTDLCREVTGLPDTQGFLDHICRDNLFLMPFNTERTWYRYHHMFSEAIRLRVKRSSPDLVREVNQKAALWFVRNDYLEDAFRHAFASEDYEFAADLLEDHLFLLYERYDVASALRWLAKLPHKIFVQRALLRLYECGFKIESCQLLDIEITLTDIARHQAQTFERYKGFKRKLCDDLLTYFQHVLPYYQDLHDADVNKLNEAIRRVSPENKFYYGFIKNMATHSWRYLLQGNSPLASDALKEALSMISPSESVWARMTWFRSMAYIEKWQGHLQRMETVLQEAFSFLDRKGLSDTPVRFIFYLPMAWVFYFRNHLEKALGYGDIALKHAEQVTDVTDIVEGSVLLCLIHQAMDEWEKVNQYIQKMQLVARAVGKSEPIAFANAVDALLSMAKSDLRWAEQWADQRKLSMDEPFCFRFVFECLAQAELFYRQKRYEEAANILETIRKRCVERNIIEPVLYLDLIHSATLKALGEPKQAKAVMEKILMFSETEGYVQPIVSYTPIISPILKDIAGTLSNNQKPPHFTAVMKACGIDTNSAVEPNRSRGRGRGDLTPREVEILELMAVGYRNKEIAERASVSLNTVKTHVKSIFEKLDVKTRTQAVRQANELEFF